MNNMKIPFIIGGSIVILLAAGLMWNYTETVKEKNAIERQRIESEERMKTAELKQKQEAADAVADRAKQEEEDRQKQLDSCLQTAFENYDSNWDTSCNTLADEQEKKYQSCLSTMESNMEGAAAIKFCRNLWQTLKRSSCTLPSSAASRWDQSKKEDEQACYLRFGFKK